MGKKRTKASKQKAANNSTGNDGNLIFSGDEEEGYVELSKMGFICMEEVTEEEAKEIMNQPTKKSLAKGKKEKGQDKPDKAKPTSPNTAANKRSGKIPGSVQIGPNEMTGWKVFGLHDSLLQGLKSLSFQSPTAIQAQVLQSYAESGQRNVLGSAPTGSGKTLAFGLPMLNILANASDSGNQLVGLVIVPTRELALQIRDHLLAVSALMASTPKIVALIGGMSSEKQARLLGRKPNILIGTPGRLAQILVEEEGCHGQLVRDVQNAPVLAIDEADRMVETGHFKELDQILAQIYRMDNEEPRDRSTFLFSATLTFDAGSAASKHTGKGAESALERLRAKIRFSANPIVINLTNPHQVSDHLEISKTHCLPEEKDLYLIWILLNWQRRRPSRIGKVLVFVNSIDILKRVLPVVEIFGFPTASLHAQMQQRQRLVHFDKFKVATNMVLISSDVSARGIDIQDVDLIIHYHLPNTAETFVHRCGRTGRGLSKAGASVALISPQEVDLESKIVKHLKLKEIPNLHIDFNQIDQLKPLVDAARRIEVVQNAIQKTTKDKSWEAKAAEALGVDLDDDDIICGPGKKQKRAKTKHDDDSNDAEGLGRRRKELASLKITFQAMLKACQ